MDETGVSAVPANVPKVVNQKLEENPQTVTAVCCMRALGLYVNKR